MIEDETWWSRPFFYGKGGSGIGLERLLPRTAPLKNFQKNFFGSGCGVVLNGWGVLVIRGVEWNEVGDLWSVLFWG